MNPEEVLAVIQEMMASGELTEGAANTLASENTEYPNLFALRMAVESSFDAQAADEYNEIADRPVGNFLGAAAQGATFGLADEAVEAVGFEHLGKGMRRAQNIREERAPGATALSEVAGGFMLPGIPAAGAALGPRSAPLARSALRGAARGGLVGGTAGAAGGAVAGAGFADEGERMQGAQGGAIGGGTAGALLGIPGGFLGGLFGSAAGRGGRVAREMLELSSQPDASLLASKGRIAVGKSEVQQKFYRPLQEAHQSVDDPAVMGFLQNLSTNPNLRSLVPRQFRAGSTGIRSGPGRRTGTLVRGSSVQPSFEDLQDLRHSLRGRAYDRAGDVADREALAAMKELTEVMGDAFGPALREADEAWGQLSAQERAVDKGWDFYNKPAEKIQETRDALTPDQMDYFDQGRLARITAELNVRNRDAVGLLQQYLDAGPETFARVRDLFPEDGIAFTQFQRMLKTERNTARIADFFNSTVKSGAIGASGGAITGGLMSRGQQGR